MILRRIASALRRQDEFAVAIEFVIVVVGIFVGLEVSNWNEERKLAAQERSYLVQMREEAADNVTAVGYQSRYTAILGAAVLQEIHANPALVSQLRFWRVGRADSSATNFYGSMLAYGEAAIAALDRELAGTR